MPSISQEKPVSSKLRLSADFSDAFVSGEALVTGQPTVTVVNALTDTNEPTILLGSPVISGNVVSQDVQGGVLGTTYTLTFNSGTTNLGLSHAAGMNLIITNDPASDQVLCPR